MRDTRAARKRALLLTSVSNYIMPIAYRQSRDLPCLTVYTNRAAYTYLIYRKRKLRLGHADTVIQERVSMGTTLPSASAPGISFDPGCRSYFHGMKSAGYLLSFPCLPSPGPPRFVVCVALAEAG